MKVINYYVITKNSDSIEGKGREVETDVAFTTEKDAIEFASSHHYKKYAVMGVVDKKYAKHSVSKKTIMLFESVHDYSENNEETAKARLIASAMEKLTPEELKALGLEDL
jgi:hypothetical protein